MTFTLDALQNEINEVVDIHEQALEATEGSGKRTLEEGTAIAVVTGYVELGEHLNKKNVAKNLAILEVELFDIEGESQKYTREVEFEEDGKKVKKTVGSKLSHNFNNISRNDRANFRKEVDTLFEACQLEGVKSPIRLIGQKFLVDVVHNKSDDGKKTYVNLDLKNAAPAFATNRVGKPLFDQPLDIPVDVNTLSLRMFLWEAPTAMQWKSIEIEGTYEVEEEGKKVEKSKNWIQERIRSAENFADSPIESLLLQQGNSGTPLPKATKATETKEAPKVEKEVKEEPKVEVATEAPEKVSEPVSADSGTTLSPELQKEKDTLLATKEQLSAMGLDTAAVDARLAEIG